MMKFTCSQALVAAGVIWRNEPTAGERAGREKHRIGTSAGNSNVHLRQEAATGNSAAWVRSVFYDYRPATAVMANGRGKFY